MEQVISKAYKIIGPEGYGTNATAALRKPKPKSEYMKEIIEEHPHFFPKYEEGKEASAVPGTSGIFCFRDVYDAIKFASEYSALSEAKLHEVEGYGTPVIPKTIIRGCMNLENLVEPDIFDDKALAPDGTIAFQKIKVGKVAIERLGDKYENKYEEEV